MRAASLFAGFLLAAVAACDDTPAPAPAPSATVPATTTPEPAPPPKPTLPPTIAVDTSGVLVAGTRVSLDGNAALERVKSELAQHASFIDGKEVHLSADRQVKPAYVATVVEALGAAGATRALVHTTTRSEFPNEVGFVSVAHARSAPPCTLVAIITEDRGSAVWSIKGGVAGKRGKGMAGPDLTLTGESLTTRAKKCPDSKTLFVGGAPGVEWGLVYDLAASAKSLPKLYFADLAVLAESPVPGHAVDLGH